MESYRISGNQLNGPVQGTVQANGDITYSHGYTSRKDPERESEEGSAGKAFGGAINLDEVARAPASFALVLSGHHDHPDCNGRYTYDGEENGKPKWAKEGRGGSPKLFWTGHSWDCFWGGYSPEAHADTPVPPLDGYDSDKGGCEIRVSYEHVMAAPGALLDGIWQNLPPFEHGIDNR